MTTYYIWDLRLYHLPFFIFADESRLIPHTQFASVLHTFILIMAHPPTHTHSYILTRAAIHFEIVAKREKKLVAVHYFLCLLHLLEWEGLLSLVKEMERGLNGLIPIMS